MSGVGQREIQTQKRVIAFLRDALGYDLPRPLEGPRGQQQHRGGSSSPTGFGARGTTTRSSAARCSS